MKTDKTTEIVERLKERFPEPEYCDWKIWRRMNADHSRTTCAAARITVPGHDLEKWEIVAEVPYDDLPALLSALPSAPASGWRERPFPSVPCECGHAAGIHRGDNMLGPCGSTECRCEKFNPAPPTEIKRHVLDPRHPQPDLLHSKSAEPVSDRWLCAGKCGQWKHGTPAAHNGSGPVCAECESASEAPTVGPGESEAEKYSAATTLVNSFLYESHEPRNVEWFDEHIRTAAQMLVWFEKQQDTTIAQLRERVAELEWRLVKADKLIAAAIELDEEAGVFFGDSSDCARKNLDLYRRYFAEALAAYRKLTSPTPAEKARTETQ